MRRLAPGSHTDVDGHTPTSPRDPPPSGADGAPPAPSAYSTAGKQLADVAYSEASDPAAYEPAFHGGGKAPVALVPNRDRREYRYDRWRRLAGRDAAADNHDDARTLYRELVDDHGGVPFDSARAFGALRAPLEISVGYPYVTDTAAVSATPAVRA